MSSALNNFKHVFAAAAVAIVAIGEANAFVVVTAVETGGNVVFSGGGTLNLQDLSIGFTGSFVDGYVNPSIGTYQGAGSPPTTNANIYQGLSFTGPASFGTGSAIIADFESGDFGGIRGSDFPGVIVADTYSSGTPLFGTSIFSGQTFASLGLIPGIYKWTWGNTNSDSYTLNIGAVPGPMPIIGAAIALGYSQKLRKRIKDSKFAESSAVD